jgi:hypothetical protein
MSEYIPPTTLPTILVVTCVWQDHVVSHPSSARRGEEATPSGPPEQSAVFRLGKLTSSFFQASNRNAYRLMVFTFLAVFSISPEGGSGKLLENYLT